MNLAYRFPIIFWNTACLICNSGGAEAEDIEEEIYFEEFEVTSLDMFTDESDEDDDDEEDNDEEEDRTRKKKKTRSSDYGKIASAIGKMAARGIVVSPPDINKSGYTFAPEVEDNIIRYGLSGIVKVGEDIVKEIIDNRPYSSIEDFLSKVKVNKPQMINLIKCGAFDSFGERVEIMKLYVNMISETKKDLNLRNVQMLLKYNLIPDEYDLQRKVFNFNKYLKKLTKNEIIYFDEIAYNFYSQYFDVDKLTTNDDGSFEITKAKWKPMYDKHMDILRKFIKDNKPKLLEVLNYELTKEIWDKYCLGSISKWEMDSVSFYSHEHELIKLKREVYDISRFAKLPEEPIVASTFKTKDGKQIPLFKICRIAGTILDKNKNKNTLTLLTNEGVVIVKIFGEVFNYYDKQLSEKGVDGKKHVIEKSFFTRGNKVIITGIRCGDSFIAKKYSKTPWHLVELIESINEEGFIKSKGKRYGDEEE